MINQNWVFGNNSGIDFSTPTPTPTSGFGMNTREGSASVSDQSGNLLFFTDGQRIWDSGNIVRATGLQGDSSSTQSSIIVPDPGNTKQYYIFTMDGSTNSVPPFNHFNGGVLNVDTWGWTSLASLMTLPDTTGLSPAEKLTAIQHKNCKDFWVITLLQRGTDGTRPRTGINNGLGVFRIYKVDSSGVQHVGDTQIRNNIHELGYLKGSPNGDRIAVANGANANVLVAPFDNSTGVIDTGALQSLQVPTSPQGINRTVYGVEFSPNGSLLYYGNLASRNQQGYIFQVDLTVTSPSSTLVGTIPNGGGRYVIGALQLGIDNRIYFAKDNEGSLGAILNPDTPGAGCNVDNNFIQLLPGSACQLGLPNLLPNPCEDDCGCGGCHGCNYKAETQNEELIERAKAKFQVGKSSENCNEPYSEICEEQALRPEGNFDPCFYLHWGDDAGDQIEEHDTEIFYLTVCNKFSDIEYTGLRVTKLTLVPDIHPLDKIQIVPDRFINFDCLKSCSCQTREFALITRANDTAGSYSLEVEYCYEGISLSKGGSSGSLEFPIEITED